MHNAGRIFLASSPTGAIAVLAGIFESDILESQPLAVQITDLVANARWRGKGVGTALSVHWDLPNLQSLL